MRGPGLGSKTTILPEDRAIGPAGLPIVLQLEWVVGNVHYQFSEEHFSFYVYVLGR